MSRPSSIGIIFSALNPKPGSGNSIVFAPLRPLEPMRSLSIEVSRKSGAASSRLRPAIFGKPRICPEPKVMRIIQARGEITRASSLWRGINHPHKRQQQQRRAGEEERQGCNSTYSH